MDDFSIRDVQESFSKVLFFQVVISKIFMFSPKIGEDESHFDDFDVSSCQKVVGSLVFCRFLGYEARNMEKRAQTTLLKQKLGEIKEPLKDTSEENLAKVDPEKELNHLPTLSFKGMC